MIKIQKFTSVIVGIVCFVLIQNFGHAGAEDALSREIEQVENDRIQAMLSGDYTVLEKILSDDLMYTHSNGKVETKKEFMDLLRSGRLKYKAFDRDNIRICQYGKIAVITGRAVIRVEFDSKEFTSPIQFTAVYVKQEGIWQIVAWQSTRISFR